MNRTEALQAAFMIAGPNVTADEHIQYAEFLLGEHVTYVKNYITGEDTQSICDDPREYNPDVFAYKVGDRVFECNDDRYHVGAVARDYDGDVWVKTENGWDMYMARNGNHSKEYSGIVSAALYQSVFVA